MSDKAITTGAGDTGKTVAPSGMPWWVGRIAVLTCVVAAAAYAGRSWWTMRQSVMQEAASEQSLVRAAGIVDPSPKRLANTFSDGRGLLLADPPKDATQLLDPREIVLGHLDSDPDTQSVDWSAVEKHVSAATGVSVVDRVFDNSPAQLEEVRAGTYTVIALHAADTPFLVNNYGFHPAAMMGNEGGAVGNRLDLLVPAGSAITRPDDLRGKTLTCSEPTSITGYRAAVALLLQNQQLRPNVDYYINWSLKMKESIKGVADRKYEAAAVSDDKLQSLLAKGTVKASQCRVIYQSDVIPRMTIGTFYNLKPELAEKIRSAILSFRPAATADAEDEDAKPMRFLPVDYKKDFALVRQIDDRFEPRLDTHQNRSKKSAEVTAAR